MNAAVLEIRNAGRVFRRGGRETVAVRSMSLAFPAETPRLITLAGESGCGKTTLALMALGFIRPTSGQILYRGQDIATAGRVEFKRFRRNVQAVFQNPYEAFNPVYRIERVLGLTVRLRGESPRSPAGRELMTEALRRVRLEPERVLRSYPHQLSGGQLQRISIARAMLLEPEVLVADEPVSMVDASLRLLILRHLVQLKEEFGISILYITHDLSTALQISDELLIAYRGEVVERGDPAEVIGNPRHEYTRLLVGSVPLPDPRQRWTGEVEIGERLAEAR
jgi:peptide/nickel transport system ATP-binding protein